MAKRNMDLILRILLYVEEKLPAKGTLHGIPYPEFSDHDGDTVQHHVALCVDAGFIKLGSARHILQITWEGYDALEDLRSTKPVITESGAVNEFEIGQK